MKGGGKVGKKSNSPMGKRAREKRRRGRSIKRRKSDQNGVKR